MSDVSNLDAGWYQEPLADAWTVNTEAVEANIQRMLEETFLSMVEHGLTENEVARGMAKYEVLLRAKMAECITSAQARLRAELRLH